MRRFSFIMEQNGILPLQLLQEGVSLAVLVFVLTGIYRLTNRFIDVMVVHLTKCCSELARIANALDTLTEKDSR